jgi:hexokinase
MVSGYKGGMSWEIHDHIFNRSAEYSAFLLRHVMAAALQLQVIHDGHDVEINYDHHHVWRQVSSSSVGESSSKKV